MRNGLHQIVLDAVFVLMRGTSWMCAARRRVPLSLALLSRKVRVNWFLLFCVADARGASERARGRAPKRSAWDEGGFYYI